MSSVQTQPTEPAGVARFQAASAAAQAANAANPPKPFIDQLKETPEDAMTALEVRITELEAVVHRLAAAADGEHRGISAWMSRVAMRIRGLL